ncbi:MAG: hypothetical protein OXM57_13500 [bacterium]|nr:hypothetical protein [bacterium]MDE0353692.1 hypothetical protein [bacterium]
MSDRDRNGSRGFPPDEGDPLGNISFEEFQLREPSSWEEAEYRPSMEAESHLTCPSCFSQQSPTNRHCQECGARLGRRRIAVAPMPIRSVTAGNRAVRVIITGVAFVVILALIIQAMRGGDDEPGAGPDETTAATEATEPTMVLGPLEEITPISITCSSEYNAGLACENLIDGEETYWNDASRRGEDARITVTFVNPVALEQVQIINVNNLEKFRRNYRVRDVEIFADDFPGVPFVDDIPDANDRPHGIPTTTNHTSVLEIRVTSTWPSEALGGEAFDELAIQEIKFWGRVQDTSATELVGATSG